MPVLWERLLKPILVAAVAFGSVYWMTGDPLIAFWCALIPLALGILHIMQTLAYAFAGLTLIVAVFFTIVPASVKATIADIVNDAVARLKQESPGAARPTGTAPSTGVADRR